MHIEKKFFDNLIKTSVLNVPRKNKDSIKSRMDLPLFCKKPELEVSQEGRVHIPIFRLSKEGKAKFLTSLRSDIKFPDGYVSKFSHCVNVHSGKILGLKSHDCHVIMERLLPIEFKQLLLKYVHVAISGNIL